MYFCLKSVSNFQPLLEDSLAKVKQEGERGSEHLQP